MNVFIDIYFFNIEHIFLFKIKVFYFIGRLQVLLKKNFKKKKKFFLTLRISDLQKFISCAQLSMLCLLGWSLVAGSLTLSRNNSSKLLVLCGVIAAVEFNSDGCAPEIHQLERVPNLASINLEVVQMDSIWVFYLWKAKALDIYYHKKSSCFCEPDFLV